ncbi:MAG: mobile mystery protein A, partial [Alphaproteobacteria bacterium]|nr:mobile mystery protein A [Alphaproteobacteria bacterium]
NSSQKSLGRKHIEQRVAGLRNTHAFSRPPRGWVRAIRDALGMTAAQLGRSLGVSQPRIAKLEQAEVEGSLTLASLKAAAEAMNCTFVYALVPNAPLDDLLRHRAEIIADKQLKWTHHTMKLENQALTPQDLKAQRARLIEKLLEGNLHRLWDEND